tara:strand:- start:49 stop:927 length:879 start_codon:yes stop_codon:yes gene_type:complete
MKCGECGHDNPVDATFCERCGISLLVVCSDCAEENNILAEFCRFCGAGIVSHNQSSPEPATTYTEDEQDSLRTAPESDSPTDDSWNENAGNVWSIIFGAIILIVVLWQAVTWGIDKINQEGTRLENSIPPQNQAVSIESLAPIIFSDEQASSFLLNPDDFPNNWTAKKNGMILDAKNDYLTDFNLKTIKITLETQETEAAAQAAFSAKKSEAQTTIDGRGISGDKLEDVKKYPLFVWNSSQQAHISGVEKWTVIGVYGNITVKVYHEGSKGAPNKGLAVGIAKKQIDRIKGD